MAVYQYLSPCCRFASAILAVVLLQWNRKKGIRSAGTLIIFWLLMTVYGAVKFRTYLLIHIYGSVRFANLYLSSSKVCVHVE
jgi:hypothetical protein